MEIRFRTNQLRDCAADLSAAVRQWGSTVGARYHQRLQVIRSLEWDDLLRVQSLRLHPLRGTRSGQYAADLSGRWRLVISRHSDIMTVEEVSNHYDD